MIMQHKLEAITNLFQSSFDVSVSESVLNLDWYFSSNFVIIQNGFTAMKKEQLNWEVKWYYKCTNLDPSCSLDLPSMRNIIRGSAMFLIIVYWNWKETTCFLRTFGVKKSFVGIKAKFFIIKSWFFRVVVFFDLMYFITYPVPSDRFIKRESHQCQFHLNIVK